MRLGQTPQAEQDESFFSAIIIRAFLAGVQSSLFRLQSTDPSSSTQE
jgi:hypothetical protein